MPRLSFFRDQKGHECDLVIDHGDRLTAIEIKSSSSARQSWQTIESDNVVTSAGLGFLDDVIMDQHFVRRRRHTV